MEALSSYLGETLKCFRCMLPLSHKGVDPTCRCVLILKWKIVYYVSAIKAMKEIINNNNKKNS